jgi:TrmH family RNA methyltransferase
MHEITSTNNQQVKDWKKLLTRREREKKNRYLIEGYHLIEEAFQFKPEDILQVIAREDIVDNPEFTDLPIDYDELTVVSEEVAEEISDTETNQGIFAELKIQKEIFPKNISAPFLLLDGVQDPGNVGTMIRTAAAAGFQGVFLGAGTVDLYNPKTLRSAQGSHFHLEIYEGTLQDFILEFKKNNFPVLGTALNLEAQPYKEVTLDTPFALMVGNEGAGIRDELLGFIDTNIYIPMKGDTESLNVAIAASILMFHLN